MDVLLTLLLLNIITHIILFFMNQLKTNFTYPMVFKSVTYLIIASLNIIVFYIIMFMDNIQLTTLMLTSYIAVTVVMHTAHFILDEDDILRFEKLSAYSMIIILTLLLYTVWYFLIM